jgi:hypothetical protein
MPRKVEGRALGERCRAWAYGAALAYWAGSGAWWGGGEEVEDVGQLEGFGDGLVVWGTGGGGELGRVVFADDGDREPWGR